MPFEEDSDRNTLPPQTFCRNVDIRHFRRDRRRPQLRIWTIVVAGRRLLLMQVAGNSDAEGTIVRADYSRDAGGLAAFDDAKRLQLLVDAVVDYAIYMLDLNGCVVRWNSGAARLKGYSSDEIVGEHFSRFYTPEDIEAGIPDKALATARETGRFEAEGWRVRKDGSRFWASVVLDAVHDEEGNHVGYAKVTRDITDRQLAFQALLDSERRYRQLIDAVVDYAIFQLDRTGRIASWNTGAQRIKGYSQDEILGKHFSIFYTDEDRAAGLPDNALEVAAESGKCEMEGWRVRNDGSRFWALVVIDAIRDESGNVIGFAKITRDITERYEAQQQLRQAQTQLAASQKMEAVGQLSGGIAHDFNNLLMIVIGNLETAQHQAARTPANPNLARALNNAMRGAQRAAALTSRLLAFSRRQALDPKPIDVTKFLGSTAEFIQRTLGEHIEVEAVGAPGLWSVEADGNQLESALVNLAINARDAMPDGGKLTIEGANVFADENYSRANPEIASGQYVAICVSDTGTGMSRDVLDRAFEPFFTTKELGQGTGLGLSQVYGFVKQSGGHVKIYSEPGQGTTVKIYLPRLVGKWAQDDLEAAEAPPGADESEAILVVEDDADVRAYLAEVLRSLDYRVTAVPNIRAALEIIAQKERRIDLLLTDIVMPGGNGRELAHEALKMRPELPVLYMTGYSRNAVVHQGRLDEGVDLLQKPVSQAQLATRVRIALDRGRR
ncbi:MAG TPA: PAS domain S-box protein [Pseudolabrys sp.]|nr:PAS domain S-box protein [Pseudolabrys sp.]